MCPSALAIASMYLHTRFLVDRRLDRMHSAALRLHHGILVPFPPTTFHLGFERKRNRSSQPVRSRQSYRLTSPKKDLECSLKDGKLRQG